MIDNTPPPSLDLDGFKRIGYRPLIVTVNGAVQRYAVAYNVTDGWVERYKLDEAGRFVTCENGNTVTELVHGIVMVFWA